jgi:hypothetical protein
MTIVRTTISFLFLIGLSSQIILAQPRKGKQIKASIGYGLSFPYEDEAIYGAGFYAQAEYVVGLKTRFGIRPYADVMFTSPDKNQKPL